jgi:arabinose-5-phosphate isomerase
LKTNLNLKEIAQNTLISQSESILKLCDFINQSFENVIDRIYKCEGRLIVSGIGKSAIIAQKMVATFNSTGTPSQFLHASEAVHGDLGMIQPKDLVIIISNSGNSPEIKILAPIVKNFGNILVAMTGNDQSVLAKNADFVINTWIKEEACPNNLAPINSTTAQLVMGDVLAVCLMKIREFNAQDFAKYHPGGALGKKLMLKVKDILDQTKKPMVELKTPVKKVIFEISEKRLGVTAVVENEKVIGIITDGDIRRMLNNHDNIQDIIAEDIMSTMPKIIESDRLAVEALNTMENNKITQLIVVDNDIYKGIIHLHDILKEGIVTHE